MGQDQSREARRLRERQAASSAAATNEIPKLARLDYRDLQTATNNFSPDGVINRDQHGNETFLGSFQGRQVVIKRMQLNSNEGADLLIARLEPYSQLQHQNILPVVGVCIHKDALDVVLHVVRPHARNGSTGDRLHHQNGMPPLLFGTRLHIAIGAAKALAYMHEKEMVHRNFNSSVVLLDHAYNAKVSGMALRSKAPSAQSGYLDPVFDETGEVDAMSDIYSYGVFLLELLTGQLAYDSARSPPSLVGRMRPLLKSGKALDLMDASVVWPPETATALADVAAGCIKRDPEDRTPLQQVIVVLEQQAEQHGLYQAYYYYPPQDDSAPSAPPAEELPTPTASTPYPPAQQEPTSRTPYPNTKPYTQPTPSYTPYPDLGSNMSHIVEPKPSYTPYPDLGPNAGSSTGPKSTFPNPNPALQQASKPATGKFPYPSGIASSKYEPRCALCMVGNIDARLLPCTHAVTCTPCAAYLKAQSPVCPVCRARVTGWSDINSATGNDDDEDFTGMLEKAAGQRMQEQQVQAQRKRLEEEQQQQHEHQQASAATYTYGAKQEQQHATARAVYVPPGRRRHPGRWQDGAFPFFWNFGWTCCGSPDPESMLCHLHSGHWQFGKELGGQWSCCGSTDVEVDRCVR